MNENEGVSIWGASGRRWVNLSLHCGEININVRGCRTMVESFWVCRFRNWNSRVVPMARSATSSGSFVS